MFQSIPWAIIVSVATLLAALYLDLRQPFPVAPPWDVMRPFDALAVEYRHEAGDLVLAGPDSDPRWTISYRKAMPEYFRLLEESRTLARLPEGDAASEAIKRIADCLRSDPQSEEEARSSVLEAGKIMEGLRTHLREVDERERHPVFFRSDYETQYVAEFGEVANRQTDLLDNIVRELRRESGYISPSEPITVDLLRDVDRRDNLISLSEHACRTSRAAYVFVYAAWNESSGDRHLRQRFLDLQDTTQQITGALARHSALADAQHSDARRTLAAYATSMQRRLLDLGHDGPEKSRNPMPNGTPNSARSPPD